MRSVHSEIISCTRTPEFLGERTSFHPWWAGKEKQPPVRMNFSSRTDQLMPTKWRPGKTEHLFHRTPPSGYFCRCSFRGWWQIFFLMWTWGAPLATCILDIYSLKSIRYLFNKIQLLKKSFNNIKDQCQNMNFNTPIDTSAVIYYYLNLWSQKISFKNLFKLFKPNMLEYMCLLYY